MTYNVFGGTLSLTQSINKRISVVMDFDDLHLRLHLLDEILLLKFFVVFYSSHKFLNFEEFLK